MNILSAVRARFRRGGLTARLALGSSLTLIFAIGAVGWHSAQHQADHVRTAAERQTYAHATDIVAASRQPILLADLAQLEDILRRVARAPNVLEVAVSDAQARVLAHVGRDTNGVVRAIYTNERHAPPIDGRADGRALVEQRDGELQVWQPVESGSVIGWVWLRYDLAEVAAYRNEVLTDTAGLVLAVLVMSLVLLTMFLERPLSALRRATDFARTLRTSSGSQLPVELNAPVEIENLVTALNETSAALHYQNNRAEISTRALREREQYLVELFRHARDGFMTLDLEGRVVAVNPSAEYLTGLGASAMVGKHFADLGVIAQGSLAGALESFRRVVSGGDLPPFEFEMLRPGGSALAIEVRSRLLRRDGVPIGVEAILRDITERRRAEGLAQRLGRVLDSSAHEIYIFDADSLRYVQVNTGAQRNLGYPMVELATMTPLDLAPQLTPTEFQALLEPLYHDETDVLTFETVHRRRNGTTYPVEVRMQLSHTEHPPVFVAIVQDITDRKNTETRLQYLANFDTLTGLPNRILLAERLDQAITEADRHQRLAAAMFVDLDNFKIVNDSLGHKAGDLLLKHAARELQGSVRPGDTVARLGGDEFVIVLANVAHVDDIARVAQKMLDTLAQPVTIAGRAIVVTPSIGITVYPFDDQTGEGLLKNADTAMYHAKERGRNNFQFFTADLNTRVERRMALELALRHALERGELSLHYQPQADLLSGRVIGLEALLRWRHPQWGMVSPLEFVPVAEETGLIAPIGEWVLREACATAARLHADGHPGLTVSVNLSARQFDDPRLPEAVARALTCTGLPAAALDLEVTESLLMQNIDDAVRMLDTLAAQGIKISLDDFGTGYSSLSHLKRLPIDALKVDRAFVRDVTSNPNDAAIVRAVIALAHALGIEVVAEGVETEGQLAFLRHHGCHALQGYLFAKPMDAATLCRWLGTDPRLSMGAPDGRGVLVVENDASVRHALERVLSGDGHRVFGAPGASAALAVLAHEDISVVICGERLPPMGGSELLARMRERHPLVARILLTVQAEGARDHGVADCLLVAPWDDRDVRAAVARVLSGTGTPGATSPDGSEARRAAR